MAGKTSQPSEPGRDKTDQIIEGEATDISEDSPGDQADPEPGAAADDTETPAAEAGEPASDAPGETATPDTDTGPAPAPAPPSPAAAPSRGPGFLPLALGGVLAAALGYGAAYLGYLPDRGTDGEVLAGLSDRLATQSGAIGDLETRIGGIAAELSDLAGAEPPEVDLTPLEDRIGGVGSQLSDLTDALASFEQRLATLEARPIITGDQDSDAAAAAMAAAVAQLEASLREQQAQNDALADEIRTLAASAEDSITAAEARAENRVATATAQAALGQLRIAVATGSPFSGALADVAAGTEVPVPDALQAAADTGVPTLDELQAGFPALARRALPLALRDTAGEGAMDRLGAFIRGQVGGRSLDPREGDDPDAVLSRAEAALAAGDLAAVLDTLSLLPDAAQAPFADWTAEAGLRLSATEAMDSFAAALDGAN